MPISAALTCGWTGVDELAEHALSLSRGPLLFLCSAWLAEKHTWDALGCESLACGAQGRWRRWSGCAPSWSRWKAICCGLLWTLWGWAAAPAGAGPLAAGQRSPLRRRQAPAGRQAAHRPAWWRRRGQPGLQPPPARQRPRQGALPAWRGRLQLSQLEPSRLQPRQRPGAASRSVSRRRHLQPAPQLELHSWGWCKAHPQRTVPPLLLPVRLPLL
jgi:hypothetical protein